MRVDRTVYSILGDQIKSTSVGNWHGENRDLQQMNKGGQLPLTTPTLHLYHSRLFSDKAASRLE